MSLLANVKSISIIFFCVCGRVGAKFVLEFHISIFLTCEERVRFLIQMSRIITKFFTNVTRLVSNPYTCEEMVPISNL